LEIKTCENRFREIPSGLTIARWCELGDSGASALKTIRERLAAAAPESLAKLDITRDADGEFRIPVRTLLVVGWKPGKTPAGDLPPRRAAVISSSSSS